MELYTERLTMSDLAAPCVPARLRETLRPGDAAAVPAAPARMVHGKN
jgi:hypothetical protein